MEEDEGRGCGGCCGCCGWSSCSIDDEPPAPSSALVLVAGRAMGDDLLAAVAASDDVAAVLSSEAVLPMVGPPEVLPVSQGQTSVEAPGMVLASWNSPWPSDSVPSAP